VADTDNHQSYLTKWLNNSGIKIQKIEEMWSKWNPDGLPWFLLNIRTHTDFAMLSLDVSVCVGFQEVIAIVSAICVMSHFSFVRKRTVCLCGV
jgi:hypothetical protein